MSNLGLDAAAYPHTSHLIEPSDNKLHPLAE